MEAVVDTSTLISLAWAGVLDLVGASPMPLLVPAGVLDEAVTQGRAQGHPDATAIEAVVAGLEVRPSTQEGSVDHEVLRLAREVGLLVTNDVALGRRASNLGVGWLRTADLVVACVRTGRIGADRGLAALLSLHHSGRITRQLLDAYREEMR